VVAVLSVALPTVILAGGPQYQLTKGITAGIAFLGFSPMNHPGD
jgi:hypothetical protein